MAVALAATQEVARAVVAGDDPLSGDCSDTVAACPATARSSIHTLVFPGPP